MADVIALGSIPIRMLTQDWVQEHIFIAAPNFYQRIAGAMAPSVRSVFYIPRDMIYAFTFSRSLDLSV